jgi:hypothetical protein
MRSVLIGILLNFGQGVHAQTWMSLSQLGEENRFYIDTESIVSNDTLRRATGVKSRRFFKEDVQTVVIAGCRGVALLAYTSQFVNPVEINQMCGMSKAQLHHGQQAVSAR